MLDPDVCNKWDFQSLFVRMAQSQELPAQMRDIVFEAQVSEMMLLITLATGSGQTTAPAAPTFWCSVPCPTCKLTIRTRPSPR